MSEDNTTNPIIYVVVFFVVALIMLAPAYYFQSQNEQQIQLIKNIKSEIFQNITSNTTNAEIYQMIKQSCDKANDVGLCEEQLVNIFISARR